LPQGVAENATPNGCGGEEKEFGAKNQSQLKTNAIAVDNDTLIGPWQEAKPDLVDF